MPCASCDLLSLEFAVNLRWALSYATSRLDPTTEQHYAVVLQHLPTLEAVLSSSFAHISHAAALPFGAVEVSRSAVLHLLLAESLLGASPPTMHAFLLRATATPENSARSTVAHECGGAAARTTSSTSSTTTQSIHLSSVPFSARSARDVRAMGDVASSALTRGGPHTAETQSMLMLIRWLLVENILHVDELAAALEVPLDDLTISKMHADTSPTTTTTPSSSSVRVSAALGSSSTERKTRFATHVLMATRMAQSSPFYLGAHIVLSRALLLHYANHLLRTEDVMCHVRELSPAEWPDVRVAEVASVEEALSAWLVSVLQMSHTATTCAGVAPHVLNSLRLVLMRKEDGLYAALMDGVALSVVLHFYHPEMMPLERIHAPTHNNNNNNIDDDVDDDEDVGGTKVLLPQREAVRNWSAILRCAEILGLNASLVAVEVAQHGCTTLRIHLLRFVEELFAVLATDAEESVRVTMEQQQQQQQQHVDDDDDDDDDVKKSGNVGLSSEAQRSLRASYDRSSASSSTHRRSAPPSSTTRAQPTSATTTTRTPSSSSPAAQPTSSAAKTQHAMPQSYTAHPMVLRPTPTPTSTVVEEHNNNKNNASAPSRQIYVAEGGVDAKEDGRRLPISAALVPLRDDELVDVLNVGGDAHHADEDDVLRLMGQPQRVRAVRCGDATRTTTTTSTPPPPSLTSLLSSAAQHVAGVRTQPPTCAVMAPRMQHLPPPPPLQRQLNHISTAVALTPESCLDEVVVADVVARTTTDVEVVLAAQSSETTPLTLADSPVARRITTTSNNNNNNNMMMMMIAPPEAAVELFDESCGDIPPRRSTTVAEVSDLIRNNTAEEVMMMAPLSIEHGSTTNTASMPNTSSPRRALVRDAVDAEEGSTKQRHQIQYSTDVVVAKVNDDDGDGDDDVIDVDDETLLRQMPTSMLPQGHSPLPTNPSPIDVADDDDDGSSPHTRSPHTPEEVDVSPFLPPSSASLSPVMGSELPSLFSSSRRSHARDDESWFSSVSQPRGGQHNNNNNNNTLSSSSSYRQRQRRSAAMIDELIVQLASIDLATLSEEERESLRNVVAQQHAHIQHASKNNNNNNNNTHGEEEDDDDDDGTQPRRELSSSRGGPTPLSIMREGSYFDEPSEADLRRRRVAFRDVYPPGALDRMCGRRSTRASSAGSIATVERMGSVASARFSDGASQLAETEVSSIATRRLAMESP